MDPGMVVSTRDLGIHRNCGATIVEMQIVMVIVFVMIQTVGIPTVCGKIDQATISAALDAMQSGV